VRRRCQRGGYSFACRWRPAPANARSRLAAVLATGRNRSAVQAIDYALVAMETPGGKPVDLALFDFDGTITTRGAYPGFIRFAIRPRRKVVAGILLGPLIVGHRVGLVSDRAIRKVMSRIVLQGEQPERLRRLGERYAAKALPDLMRPTALERVAWHKARGDLVVVVSASLDVYLEPWCASMGVDVICTQLEAHGRRVTGRYVGGDCCGEEKARRIRERYALGEYRSIYAYGDTEEDREMLDMADKKFFRWQEVGQLPEAGLAIRRATGGSEKGR